MKHTCTYLCDSYAHGRWRDQSGFLMDFRPIWNMEQTAMPRVLSQSDSPY